MKKVWRVVLTVVPIVLLVWLVWARRDDLRPIWEEPSWNLLLIAVLIAVSHFLNSLEFWVVYRAMDVPISITENWMVFTSGLLGNLLPGQLGTVYKFRYMNTVHDVSFSRNGSSYGANLVISLGSSAIVGIIGVCAYAVGSNTFPLAVFLVFLGLGLMCILLMRSSLPVPSFLPGKFAQAAKSFANGWDEIRRTPRTSLSVVAIDIAKYGITAWRFLLAFQLLGVNEKYSFFMVMAPAAAIAGIIAFTPGGIGFRELFVTAAAVGMGSGFDTGLLAVTTDRGVMLLSALVLGTFGYWFTTSRMRHAKLVRTTP